MADPKKKKVVKKKVSPYPIDGEMVHGAAKVVLSILRVSPKGLVAEVKAGICHVGLHYQCQFKLPTSTFLVHAPCQVFKTHDGLNPKTGKVLRTVEVVFVKIEDGEKTKIRNFLMTVGQKE